MPISSGDLLFKLSIKTGTAGNQNAQGDVNESLGKYISTTEIVNATLNNLFDNVSGDENAALDEEYRCIFIHNAHSGLTLQNTKLWIDSQVANGADCEIGLDPSGASPIGYADIQAAEIADEDTAPGGVTFSAPTTKAAGLNIGNLSAGYCHGIWIKRTATNSVAIDADGITIK